MQAQAWHVRGSSYYLPKESAFRLNVVPSQGDLTEPQSKRRGYPACGRKTCILRPNI